MRSERPTSRSATRVNEQRFLNAATIKGGECWLSPDSYPILQPNGSPTVVQVHENPIPGVYVSDITYSGSGTPIAVNLCSGDILYLLGSGVNITTFTNRKGRQPEPLLARSERTRMTRRGPRQGPSSRPGLHFRSQSLR